MVETVQTEAKFDISIRMLPDGRVAIAATGNIPAPVIYANLGLIMRDLENRMRSPDIPQVGTKAAPFTIRRMP